MTCFQFEDDSVTVAGWGAVRFRGPKSPALMEGVIKVVSNEKCADKFKMFRKSESGKIILRILTFTLFSQN